MYVKSARRMSSGWWSVEGQVTQELFLRSARTASRDVTPVGCLYVLMQIVLMYVPGAECYSVRGQIVARR